MVVGFAKEITINICATLTATDEWFFWVVRFHPSDKNILENILLFDKETLSLRQNKFHN